MKNSVGCTLCYTLSNDFYYDSYPLNIALTYDGVLFEEHYYTFEDAFRSGLHILRSALRVDILNSRTGEVLYGFHSPSVSRASLFKSRKNVKHLRVISRHLYKSLRKEILL